MHYPRFLTTLRKRITQFSFTTYTNPIIFIIGFIIWTSLVRDWTPLTSIPIVFPTFSLGLSYALSFSPVRSYISTLSQLSTALALSTWIFAPIALALQGLIAWGFYELFVHTGPHIDRQQLNPSPLPHQKIEFTMIGIPLAQSIGLLLIISFISTIIQSILFTVLFQTNLSPKNRLYDFSKYLHLDAAPTIPTIQRVNNNNRNNNLITGEQEMANLVPGSNGTLNPLHETTTSSTGIDTYNNNNNVSTLNGQPHYSNPFVSPVYFSNNNNNNISALANQRPRRLGVDTIDPRELTPITSPRSPIRGTDIDSINNATPPHEIKINRNQSLFRLHDNTAHTVHQPVELTPVRRIASTIVEDDNVNQQNVPFSTTAINTAQAPPPQQQQQQQHHQQPKTTPTRTPTPISATIKSASPTPIITTTTTTSDPNTKPKPTPTYDEDDEKAQHYTNRRQYKATPRGGHLQRLGQQRDTSPFSFSKHLPIDPYDQQRGASNNNTNISPHVNIPIINTNIPTITTTAPTGYAPQILPNTIISNANNNTVIQPVLPTRTESPPSVVLPGVPVTNPDYFTIDTRMNPIFKVYQIEHPTYKSRLLGLVLGFTTGIFLFQQLLGAIWIHNDPFNKTTTETTIPPSSSSPVWSLCIALTMLWLPHALIMYQMGLLLFFNRFYHYFPFNRHFGRPRYEYDHDQQEQTHILSHRSLSLCLNMLYPILNHFIFTTMNALLLLRIFSSKSYISIPIFAVFNIIFSLYQLVMTQRLELSGLPINSHCTGTITHPTSHNLGEYEPLAYIPPVPSHHFRHHYHGTDLNPSDTGTDDDRIPFVHGSYDSDNANNNNNNNHNDQTQQRHTATIPVQ